MTIIKSPPPRSRLTDERRFQLLTELVSAEDMETALPSSMPQPTRFFFIQKAEWLKKNGIRSLKTGKMKDIERAMKITKNVNQNFMINLSNYTDTSYLLVDTERHINLFSTEELKKGQIKINKNQKNNMDIVREVSRVIKTCNNLKINSNLDFIRILNNDDAKVFSYLFENTNTELARHNKTISTRYYDLKLNIAATVAYTKEKYGNLNKATNEENFNFNNKQDILHILSTAEELI